MRSELERWFASLSPDGAPRLERLAAHERALAASELIGRRGFFTDANACLARAAWERVPFREVPYAEDRVLAIDMLRAGYAKAYMPDAAVLHSHDYTTLQELRRCFDEWRGLREVYGWREPAAPAHVARQLRGVLGQSRRELIAAGASPAERRATLLRDGPSPCRAPRGRAARLARRSAARRGAPPAVARAARGLRAARARHTNEPSGARDRPMTDEHDTTEKRPPIARPETIAASALDGTFSGPLAGLRRRIYLTYRYLGWRTLLFRVLTLPLRLTPLKRYLRLRSSATNDEYRRAVAWYAERGRPVDIVIPSYRDAEHVRVLVDSIRRTVPRELVADHRRRRRQRPGARRLAEADRGHRGRGGRARTRASPRMSTGGCAPPDPTVTSSS